MESHGAVGRDHSGSRTITLDVWSDFVCPHCYYGTRRVVAALAELPDPHVFELRWRGLQLDPRPAAARPPGDLYDYLADFNGSREAGRAAMNMIATIAAADGLDFRPDDARPGNTADAHRLVRYAAEEGRQTETVERLHVAFWAEGRPIADHDALLLTAEEAGLDRDRAREVLAGSEFTADLAEDHRLALGLGIRGVPSGVVGGRRPLALTQPIEALTAALRRTSPEPG